MFNLHATIYISKPHCALYLLYQRGSNMGSYSIHVKGIRLDLIIVFHLRIWNPTKRNGVDQLIIWDCDQLAVADWVELKSVDRTTNSISIWERAQKYLFILILIQFFLGGGVGGVGGVNHLSWPHICNIQNLSWKNTKRKKVVSFLVSMLLSVWFVLPNLRKTRAFDEKMRACIEPVIVDSVFVAVAGLTIRVLGSFFSSCSTPLMRDTQLGEITPANVNQIWLLPVRFELSDQIFCNIFNNYRNHLRNKLFFRAK